MSHNTSPSLFVKGNDLWNVLYVNESQRSDADLILHLPTLRTGSMKVAAGAAAAAATGSGEKRPFKEELRQATREILNHPSTAAVKANIACLMARERFGLPADKERSVCDEVWKEYQGALWGATSANEPLVLALGHVGIVFVEGQGPADYLSEALAEGGALSGQDLRLVLAVFPEGPPVLGGAGAPGVDRAPEILKSLDRWRKADGTKREVVLLAGGDQLSGGFTTITMPDGALFSQFTSSPIACVAAAPVPRGPASGVLPQGIAYTHTQWTAIRNYGVLEIEERDGQLCVFGRLVLPRGKMKSFLGMGPERKITRQALLASTAMGKPVAAERKRKKGARAKRKGKEGVGAGVGGGVRGRGGDEESGDDGDDGDEEEEDAFTEATSDASTAASSDSSSSSASSSADSSSEDSSDDDSSDASDTSNDSRS
jgi:hypothetical protein